MVIVAKHFYKSSWCLEIVCIPDTPFLPEKMCLGWEAWDYWLMLNLCFLLLYLLFKYGLWTQVEHWNLLSIGRNFITIFEVLLWHVLHKCYSSSHVFCHGFINDCVLSRVHAFAILKYISIILFYFQERRVRCVIFLIFPQHSPQSGWIASWLERHPLSWNFESMECCNRRALSCVFQGSGRTAKDDNNASKCHKKVFYNVKFMHIVW